MSLFRHRVHLLCTLLLSLATLVSAQEYRATLLGIVTDASGAAVAGASIVITNIDTEVRTTTQSSAEGNYLVPSLQPMPDVEIAALCDVDESVLDMRLKQLNAKGRKPAVFTDFRKLLEDKSIDAVSLATPNHHHALQTIWACQAGKDVYVEKPCTHNIFESRQIVAAARKYQRIVQHGTNSRSTVALREGMRHLRDGLLGDVYMARGLCFGIRDTIGAHSGIPCTCGRSLRSVAGSGAETSVFEKPLPLHLALVLGLRQRQLRQPGAS